ncbi:hypothetical protein G5C51_00225 [Streptomyces sp. A7024]|uniref:Glycosyl hydrolase 94 catalytic domain-containing protein n=1 Tax=Streptomyces coryli TaxID=1128680 RepID=A0A6G4TTA6_9ACTN|nr:hypothetical protein [Streptomyces coryli]NGN62338.1 hypothetical protein [Streptomyces coryli]
MSEFGAWTTVHGVPAFRYSAGPAVDDWDPVLDPPTGRRWVHLGNRRITLVADNEGRSGLWDEHTQLRWLTEPYPHGTGVSRIEGVVASDAPGAERLFGPTFARVRSQQGPVALERTVLCPEGEAPWVLIRVDVTNSGGAAPLRGRLTEEWEVRPHLMDITVGPRPEPVPVGDPPELLLERLGGERATGATGRLTVGAELDLAPGTTETFWFRCGLDDGSEPDPPRAYEDSLVALTNRLPTAHAPRAPQAAREIPWHTALLTGGACTDGVLGGHTLDQGSAYSYRHGFNGAARDPLQHALPLIYTEPDLALSVLRNTCAWASPDGELPYMLDGTKAARTDLFRPSDQNLWALWLAAEYAAATGDIAAFAEPVGFHPQYGAEPVPLAEHLRRQFRYFTDVVGTGAHGHVRIRNADWNDLVLDETGEDREAMIEHGESVLNSAMAAWVLPVYAGLARRIGDDATAAEAAAYGAVLRERVAGEWNGRWFRRGYGPATGPIGDDKLWLEVQPWAILCGAADERRAKELLGTIDELCRSASPLGARLLWPDPRGDRGAIWYAINMTLVWAAARIDPDYAWDEWRRMTLHAHTEAYPDVWEGTLSGPDSYLAPESARPGHTWTLPDLGIAMQAWPVANQHSHAQPLLGYLRLLGVEPDADGRLRVGAGADFASRQLTVRADGSGQLRAAGPVRVLTAPGVEVEGGGAGEVRWG